jgi:hypothetical protein
MAHDLELVRRYEPVLRFSKDAEGNREAFFPVAARYYVHACGLRRRGVGWEVPPGSTRLRHLGSVKASDQSYLVYAAGDLPSDAAGDQDIVLELLDEGLELSRLDGLETSLELGDVGSTVTPRVLVRRERADTLEKRLSQFGGVERQPLLASEIDSMLKGPLLGTPQAEGLSGGSTAEHESLLLAYSSLEAVTADLEWIIPRGLAALPAAILHNAHKKYEPYRDWTTYPPTYHYRVCRDQGYQVLQYWFLYAFNDWAAHGGHNDHEGDWEVIFVFLDAQDRPQHVAYSRHVKIPGIYGPSVARWVDVEKVKGMAAAPTHPVVYVGCGSHASYLKRDRYPILWLLDFAEGNDVSIGPGADQPWGRPIWLANKRWNRRFAGRWGSLVKGWLGGVVPGTEGPTGPAQKGDKWSHPARWAGIA